MTIQEVIKDIMEKQGKTNAELADALDISQQAIWDRLNSKRVRDITITTLSGMLRVLGYKVCIVPRSFRVPEDGYKVD